MPNIQNIEAKIERHVGRRIRERRILLGLTQQRLAEMIGVTYQQAHKYERGINRVSAGRLYELAQALEVEVGYFFDEFDPTQPCEQMPERQRMSLDVARNFARINDERSREALAQLCRVMADGAGKL
ncbi:MAG: helix-turn-helix transcriptional regulator [Tistlia sp.]|uniref:helix-turn-helix domain-containing protein n=1 Tax=Tistlia sp. TaxID=3057121 RepID=UPI0034A1AF0C